MAGVLGGWVWRWMDAPMSGGLCAWEEGAWTGGQRGEGGWVMDRRVGGPDHRAHPSGSGVGGAGKGHVSRGVGSVSPLAGAGLPRESEGRVWPKSHQEVGLTGRPCPPLTLGDSGDPQSHVPRRSL